MGKKEKEKKRKYITKWVKPCRIRLHNEWRIIIFISINWSVLNISHLSHILWHHVAKKTHVPQTASLKPVNRNAILWTWNVLMMCFWWISCLCNCKNLWPHLCSLPKGFTLVTQSITSFVLCFIMSNCKQASSDPPHGMGLWLLVCDHGFLCEPCRIKLLELVTLEIWRKLSLEPEFLMPKEASCLWPVESNICRRLYWHQPFCNSPKFKIKSLEMKKMARSEGTNSTNS